MRKGITIKVARQKFTKMVEADVESASTSTNTIYVYKVQAGLGKTHLILDKLLGLGVIAFPTHKLKNENHSILKSRGIPSRCTSDIFDKMESSKEKDTVLRHFESGNKFMLNKLLGESKVDIICNNTLTTHHKTMNNAFLKNVSTIFYDEDPTQTFMFRYINNRPSNFIYTFTSLYRRGFINKKELNNIKRFIASVNKYEFPISVRISPFRKKLRDKLHVISTQLDLNLKYNVVEFLDSEYFSKYSYSFTKKFAEDKNIFIFSATPDIKMIKSIAKKSKKKVKIRTIDNVRRVGKLEQTLISTTRNGMIKNEDQIKSLLALNSNTTLTFKSYVQDYNNSSDIPYGGNTQGYNGLKGHNINVAYTFQFIPDYYYHKYSVIHKNPLVKEDTMMKHTIVNWYKKKFKYYSYVNEDLRSILFTHIDNEMVQALERSRTISENCTSRILSNFICSIMPLDNVVTIKDT
jgi:hypothetical protein